MVNLVKIAMLTKEGLRRVVEQAGFEIVEVKTNEFEPAVITTMGSTDITSLRRESRNSLTYTLRPDGRKASSK